MKLLLVLLALFSYLNIGHSQNVTSLKCDFHVFKDKFCEWTPKNPSQWSLVSRKFQYYTELNDSEGELWSPKVIVDRPSCFTVVIRTKKSSRFEIMLENVATNERTSLLEGQHKFSRMTAKVDLPVSESEVKVVIRAFNATAWNEEVRVRQAYVYDKTCQEAWQG